MDNQTYSKDDERLEDIFNGNLSDCVLIVGSDGDKKIFELHKAILALESPVFASMFTIPMNESASGRVHIPKVNPRAFEKILRFIYFRSNPMNICSLKEACDIFFAAHAYMFRNALHIAADYIRNNTGIKDVCHISSFLSTYLGQSHLDCDLRNVKLRCDEAIECHLDKIIAFGRSYNFNFDIKLLYKILNSFTSGSRQGKVFSLAMFNFVKNWTEAEISRKGMKDDENKRSLYKKLICKINFLNMQVVDFALGPARSGLLTQDEAFAVLMNLTAPNSYPMPSGFIVSSTLEKLQASPSPPSNFPNISEMMVVMFTLDD